MSRLVPYGEDYVDRDKVDILTEQIWGKLHSWEDWKNITIRISKGETWIWTCSVSSCRVC